MMKNNIKAMEALSNNDFEAAQKLFRKGCRTGKSYQAFNNLGMYYIENGIICKSGKTIRGFSIGKRLLEKSLHIKETARALDNLAAIEYDSDNFNKAIEYWERSYRLTGNKTALYNISAALFRLGEYKKAVDLSKELTDDIFQAKQLSVFARCMYDKSFLELVLRDDKAIEIFDKTDILYLYYYAGKYKDVIALESQLRANENEIAILLDSYIQCGKESEGRLILRENHIDIYDAPYKNQLSRLITRLCADFEYRKNVAGMGKFVPQIIENDCQYFGCKMHNTEWN